MKTGTTFDRIQVRNLPTGRRAFLVSETKRVIVALLAEAGTQEAERAGLKALSDLCTETYDHAQICSGLERRYAAGFAVASANNPENIPVDREADHLVASVRDGADIFVTRLKPTESEHQIAATFLQNAFPNGVRYITHSTYEEQLQRMKDLVDYCFGDGAQAVATLGITIWVNRLKNLLPAYEEVIRKLPSDAVRFTQVRACQQEGHLRLRQVASQIFALFPLNDDRQEGLRKRLFAPLEHQEADVAARLKRSAPIPDVDPDTGAEVAPPLVPPADDATT